MHIYMCVCVYVTTSVNHLTSNLNNLKKGIGKKAVNILISSFYYKQRCGSAMTLCGSGSGSGSLTIKIKSPNFSKNIYSISLILSKSKILLIFKSEPKP